VCFVLFLSRSQVPFDAAGSNIDWRDLLPFTSICFGMVFVALYMFRYFKKKQYL
jgi:hypothetical protein